MEGGDSIPTEDSNVRKSIPDDIGLKDPYIVFVPVEGMFGARTRPMTPKRAKAVAKLYSKEKIRKPYIGFLRRPKWND